MDTGILIAVVVLVIAALAAAFWFISSQKKSQRLEERFGPEYERLVSDRGNKREAERTLQERQKRVEKLRLKELDADTRRHYMEQWRLVQEHFVDDPQKAVSEVDNLVEEVMDKRGYPVNDFEQQAADLSVDHPNVVTNYRSAHAIVVAHEREGVSTEDLRQAMIHYRELFNDLVEASPAKT
jgi:hypothetical protein